MIRSLTLYEVANGSAACRLDIGPQAHKPASSAIGQRECGQGRVQGLMIGGSARCPRNPRMRIAALIAGPVGITSLAYSAAVNAANSGTAGKFLPSPKLSLMFGPWFNTEFYLQAGFSFHNNDGRGTTQTIEPISPDNPYLDTPVAKIAALIPTKGAEIGVLHCGRPPSAKDFFSLVSSQCF